MPESHFSVDVIPDHDGVTVRPCGELDLATAAELDAVLTGLRERGVREVVLDLSALEFVDSAGVHLALRWTDVGGLVRRIELGGGRARALFEMTGLQALRDRPD